MSLASIGIGSVGTSPLPIFVTTFSTSGKRVFKMCAAFCVPSIVVFRLLPVNTRVSTAKSPSSNAGMNSPPMFDKMIIAETNITNTVAITDFGNCNTFSNKC